MTEQLWLTTFYDPRAMLQAKPWSFGIRKARLWAVSYCRLLSKKTDKSASERLDVAERFADGQATDEELASARRLLWWANGRFVEESRLWSAVFDPNSSAHLILERACSASSLPEIAKKKRRGACVLLRCIVGNPYRPSTLVTSLLTPTVKRLAEGIYQHRQFDNLPILADALEETGCSQTDLLGHLRGDGPHARGCWALDLAAGKE